MQTNSNLQQTTPASSLCAQFASLAVKCVHSCDSQTSCLIKYSYNQTSFFLVVHLTCIVSSCPLQATSSIQIRTSSLTEPYRPFETAITAVPKPSWRHTTAASSMSHSSSQTVPHNPPTERRRQACLKPCDSCH